MIRHTLALWHAIAGECDTWGCGFSIASADISGGPDQAGPAPTAARRRACSPPLAPPPGWVSGGIAAITSLRPLPSPRRAARRPARRPVPGTPRVRGAGTPAPGTRGVRAPGTPGPARPACVTPAPGRPAAGTRTAGTGTPAPGLPAPARRPVVAALGRPPARTVPVPVTCPSGSRAARACPGRVAPGGRAVPVPGAGHGRLLARLTAGPQPRTSLWRAVTQRRRTPAQHRGEATRRRCRSGSPASHPPGQRPLARAARRARCSPRPANGGRLRPGLRRATGGVHPPGPRAGPLSTRPAAGPATPGRPSGSHQAAVRTLARPG